MTRRSKAPRTSARSQALPQSWGKHALIVLVTDVGASVALHDLLLELPHDFPLPLVVVQHAETVIHEAHLQALRRTVPFEIQQLNGKAILEPGTVYVAEAGKTHTVSPQGRSLEITVDPGREGEWHAGESLRQFGNLLGSNLLVALLATRIKGSDLKQLSKNFAANKVEIALVKSSVSSEAYSADLFWGKQVNEVDDIQALAGLVVQKLRTLGKNQLAQSLRQ